MPRAMIEARKLRPSATINSICTVCWAPIGGYVYHRDFNHPQHWQNFFSTFNEAVKQDYTLLSAFTLELVDPPKANDIPAHLSENVARAFRSAQSNFGMPDGEDASATMYRRSIDVAIREKHPEVSGLLAGRIAKLVLDGLLPPPMKDWADQIRWIGNDGAHDPEGVTRDELIAMRGFTDAFLRYFISIPFEVSFRQGKIDGDGNPLPSTN
jgi:hypothetical protein